MPIDIATLDLTPYQSVPQLTAEATLRLIRDLDRAKPAGAPAIVLKTAARMVATGDRIEQTFGERVEDAGVASATEAGFDTACDRLWGKLRARIEDWEDYEQPGLGLLSPAAQQAIGLPDKQAKARIARSLASHLFGADGLGFLQKPFAQQVEAMGTRLRFIRSSEAAADYLEVIGEDRLATLEVLQERYDQMVHDRATRSSAVGNLRELRHTAQRHINLYNSAVIATLDEDDPTSITRMLEALQPMVNARKGRGGTGSAESEDGVDAVGLDEPALPDLDPPPPSE